MSWSISKSVLSKPLGKFSDPDWTAKGEARATVSLKKLETLWINTGSVCNITCKNCYIESSPTNDRLAFVQAEELEPIFQEAHGLGVSEIAFTGGEPFLNPDFKKILSKSLSLGFKNLVLTNAMTFNITYLKKKLNSLKTNFFFTLLQIFKKMKQFHIFFHKFNF